jgi:hypothetical protein
MTPSIDLSAETTLGWTEWGILIAIAAIACLYLWRKFFIKKGCACSSCGKAKGCSRKPQQENELRHSITFEK